MKKLVLSVALVATGLFASAQEGDATAKGKILVNVNMGTATTGNTGFAYEKSDADGADASWSLGAEGGYFVMDNLAVIGGLGVGKDGDADTSFKYKVGAKYYISNVIPVQVDLTGDTKGGADVDGATNALFVGLQAGYAWYVADNVSIEPALRYNITTDDNKAPSLFQGVIGFNLHF